MPQAFWFGGLAGGVSVDIISGKTPTDLFTGLTCAAQDANMQTP